MKHIYWITFLVLFLLYNVFINKEKKTGGYFSFDFNVFFRFLISAIIYLASWIVWFIIFK